MKHRIIWLLLICLSLTGCTAAGETEPQTAKAETEAVPSYTEQDILDMFNGYAYADPANRVVIDCVVLPESDYGILGVVQYTTDDYDGCWFDFLTEAAPHTAGVEALPAGEKTLEYVCADTITCQLVNDEAAPFACQITFYQNDLETGFKIVSE